VCRPLSRKESSKPYKHHRRPTVTKLAHLFSPELVLVWLSPGMQSAGIAVTLKKR
jgi:hypothetical protein